MRVITWLILSLTLITSLGLAAPAAARPAPTTCTGELADLTIPGDLIVPAGENCTLINVTVHGDARVHEGSTLGAHDSRIEGNLTGTDFEHVSVADASVGGRIRLTGGSSAWLERALAEGDVRLSGQVDARVLQSRVTGELVVRGTSEVALLCATTVEGDARFARHRGGLLIGDDPTAPGTCGPNEVWGNLLVQQNSSDTIIANTTIGGDLACAANDPAPVLFGNQVAGTGRGQCRPSV